MENAMFGNNLILPNRMLSYRSALATYNSIKPVRGRSDQNERPLANRRNDNLTIRLEPTTNDIIVRLYHTDIIRYNDDDVIVLDPYPSAMTNRVVWNILGPYVQTHWSDRYRGPGLITEVGGRYYHTPSFAVVQPRETGWVLVDGAKPVEVPYLNRKEAKQALRDANYYTFQIWLETRVRLGVAEFGHSFRRAPFDWTPQTAAEYLRQGETGWAEIAARMSNRLSLSAELRAIREAVYEYESCYDTKTVEYFHSYSEYKNALNQIMRVG
jgi:hypothetical protein